MIAAAGIGAFATAVVLFFGLAQLTAGDPDVGKNLLVLDVALAAFTAATLVLHLIA